MGALSNVASWPHLDTLIRLALALGLGLLVGLERERRGKEAGVRTFALITALGCAGGLIGDAYAYLSIALMLPIVILLNVQSLRKEGNLELTTSAALLVMGFAGVMCGKGQTFAPVALGVVTAGLLAWKVPLAGFSVGITEAELRSAILLAILAFIVFPVLPAHTVDRWDLVNPRAVWTGVVLIAAIGFGNYILSKVYGSTGVEAACFLAGLVNSFVAVTELASSARTDPTYGRLAYRGTMLAMGGMLIRNGALIAILAPKCLFVAAAPMILMLSAIAVLAFGPWSRIPADANAPTIPLSSPFSLKQALKFGVVFLAISVMGTLGQRLLGSLGFYAVSAVGGLVSSASSVASAGQLASQGKLSFEAGAVGAVLATIVSVAVALPIIANGARDRHLTKLVAIGIGSVVLIGLVGAAIGPSVGVWAQSRF